MCVTLASIVESRFKILPVWTCLMTPNGRVRPPAARLRDHAPSWHASGRQEWSLQWSTRVYATVSVNFAGAGIIHPTEPHCWRLGRKGGHCICVFVLSTTPPLCTGSCISPQGNESEPLRCSGSGGAARARRQQRARFSPLLLLVECHS